MKPKNSFMIILRIVFLLFSLYFIGDAFNRWDGYSHYMRFADFLPELATAFVLWTMTGMLFAFSLWAVMYGLYKIIPASLHLRLEQFTVYSVLVVIAVFLYMIKATYFSFFSLSSVIGLRPAAIMVIAGILTVALLWYGSKYAEKILLEFDSRISPVVWLFALLFVCSTGITAFENEHAETKPVQGHKQHLSDPERKRPNIIIVIMDALTAQDMQLYGYSRATTPFISEWAKDAVVFNKAYSSANWTPPGTMSIMTGQSPWTHRVWFSVMDYPAGRYENNLPSVLKNNAYSVYGFVQNAFASPKALGIGDAFLKSDAYDLFSIKREEYNSWYFKLANLFVKRPLAKKWIFGENPIARGIRSLLLREVDTYTTIKPPELVYDNFLRFISGRRTGQPGALPVSYSGEKQGPFFAYLHVLPPHEAYLPPRPYMGMFGDGDKFNSEKKQYQNFRFSQKYNVERQMDVDILRRRYDEFILYSDQQFRKFLTKLADTVDMNNTIIIFSSDHGESFSQGWLAHTGPHLYESLVHVPLVISLPGLRYGKKIDVPVSLTDIAPTILDLAGIPVPEWMEGHSLSPLIEGKPVDSYPVFSMQFSKNRIFDPITEGTVAVWEGEYKLIRYLKDRRALLYNIKDDPDELYDLSGVKTEIAQRLSGLIEENISVSNEKFKQQR